MATDSNFTGTSKPPITRHSTSTRKVTSKLRITQESGRGLGGGKGVYGLQRKITSIMSDGHRGKAGLMDLETPPRPRLYCQRRQTDSIMLLAFCIQKPWAGIPTSSAHVCGFM